MKLISLTSRLALTGLAAFLLGVVINVAPLGLFSVAAGALVLLVVVGDYAPRNHDWAASRGRVLAFAPAPARTAASEKIAA